jgi:hypothetical protein
MNGIKLTYSMNLEKYPPKRQETAIHIAGFSQPIVMQFVAFSAEIYD